MIDEPHIVVPPEPEPAPPLILLPEHTETPRHSLQSFSGVATLVLIFFASASFTAAYFSSESTLASAASQAASVAVAIEDPFASLSLIAEGVYVLDLTTNRVLYAKNSESQLPLASLVKVPLVLAVSEVFQPNTPITIPPHTTPDGAGVRLPSGLRFKAGDLMDFTLVASSNEGAAILTEAAEGALRVKYPSATAGSAALWRMNDIAKNLGLTNMVFRSTNGLDQSDTQAAAFGSAREVALLFAYTASTTPEPFGYTSQDSVKIRATTGETVTAVNTDEVLPAIPGIVMGKTGFTELAGGNLAIVFEVGPAHPVVAVVLHSTRDGRFDDMKKLVAATLEAIAAGQ